MKRAVETGNKEEEACRSSGTGSWKLQKTNTGEITESLPSKKNNQLRG